MASLCKKQQCTIDRRGFRQELDSWRHKLIHCVGFESILEGLICPELLEDLKVFKDSNHVAVSDWSFDENCIFCCLRRDKVKEHLIGLNKGLDETPKRLLVKDQLTIIRLEKQAEEFLSAVLCRKDVPNFSDPNIPVVAREILQRMISQFAAEYTSKTSSPQDSHSDSPPQSDQSLPAPRSLSVVRPKIPAATLAGPAHNQNPVLCKLLMADQDAPLDLTIKKPLAEPTEQDGVLDLSIKKNRHSNSSPPGHNPCFSPATSTLKGESPDLRVAKAKDLQSTATLEQLMKKLCPHHQRQIVDAIGFLQMEVKAHASCNAQKDSNSTAAIQETDRSSANSSRVILAKSLPELKLPSESTPKAEVQELSYSVPNSCELKKIPENAVSLKTSVNAGSALDIFSLASENDQQLATSIANAVDGENNRDGDHAPLKMKIMTSTAAAGKKLSCILNAAFSSNSETFENKQANTNSPSRGEPHSARLSTSAKRLSQTSLAHQARQMEILGNLKDAPARVFPVRMAISSDSAQTARKTMRVSSEHGLKDSVCMDIVDPDIGHCDIVFIDKPITECFKKQRRSLLPRRNARKSTRGHMYSDEIWELKTVRTLARRGSCPNPMPELITLITPKHILAKPDGVPPVDLPFSGACTETMNHQTPTEESNEGVIPRAEDIVEIAASKVDMVVEMSQTDLCQNKEQSGPASPLKLHVENQETLTDAFAEQEKTAELEMTAQSGESVDRSPHAEATKENEPEPQKVLDLNTEQTVSEAEVQPVESDAIEEVEPRLSSDKLTNGEPDLQQSTTSSSSMNQVEEAMEEDKEENIQNVQHQELQSATQTHPDSVDVTENLLTTGSAEELIVKPVEVETPQVIDSSTLAETKNNDTDASTKALDAPLKESPPPRKKKTTKRLLAESLKLTETVVGYVNGKPVSASDRSLRHRAGSNPISPSKTPVKSSQNVPNKTLPDPAADLPVEIQKVENPSPETHMPMKLVVTPPEIQQVAEPSSETSSTQASKSPLNPQKIHCDKNDQKNSLSVPPDQPHAQPPDQQPAQPPDQSLAQPPYQQPAQPPDQQSDQPPDQSPAQQPDQSPAQQPDQPPAQPPDQSLAQPPYQQPAQPPDQQSDQSPAQQPDQPPAQPPDQQPAQQPDQSLAHPPDQQPAQPPDQQPAQPPDQQPAQSPAQPPDQAQNTTHKRPLRSASHKPFVTPASVPSSSVTSLSSPKPSSLILPLAEQSPLLPYPPSVTASSLKTSPEPPASEQPQQKTETVNSNVKNTQSTEAASEDVPKSNVPTGSETKQKLRSARAVTNSSEKEKQQISEGESNSSESKSPFKTELEMEPVSVRGKRGRRRNRDVVDVALIPKKKVSLEDKSADGDGNGASVSDKPTRMPLRSETSKAETPDQSVNQLPPADKFKKTFNTKTSTPADKKLALRSQRLTTPSASSTETSKQSNVSSPARTLPERISKGQGRPNPVSVTSFSHNADLPVVTPKDESPKQTNNKFFETLMGEESQHLITNLNNKYDKLLKSWVQLDKEGQPPAKYKNKSDRQAAIWKSKRRARKSKSSEHQKYSPVQMLFMRSFNLTSICHWFLETTETKSLVIVKNVNTRLPSETQLCFHSSASASGPSQGVFPSLQAERLKKHLKKFAIASPVKSNPKSLKLIAKALEQEANTVKGMEEVPSDAPTPSKSTASDKTCAQKQESKKSSANKNPASARILRKYSNIREKMQVQQTTVRLKGASKMLKNKKMKTLAAAKSAKAKLKPSLKGRKAAMPIGKQMKESTAKLHRTKMLAVKKSAKRLFQKKAGKAPKAARKKELPKRSSQRLGSPKISEQNSVDTSKSKVTSKKQNEADKAEVEKCDANKASSAKIQMKDSSQGAAAEAKGCENAAEIKQQSTEVQSPASPDQVLTRSQRKLEAAAPPSPSPASKRAKKPKSSHTASPKVVKEADEPKLTRSGVVKRPQKSSLPRSVAKGATKRARGPLETPTKRTRTK